MNFARKLSSQKGITAAEVVVIFLVILLIGYTVYQFAIKKYVENRYLQEQEQLKEEAQVNVSNLIGNIRKSTKTVTGAYTIDEAAPFSLTFYSDINDDGLVERVRIFLEGAKVKQGIIKPKEGEYDASKEETQDIMDFVRNESEPLFIYFDQEGNKLSEPIDESLIKIIRIKLIVDKNPKWPPSPFTIESGVEIQKIK